MYGHQSHIYGIAIRTHTATPTRCTPQRLRMPTKSRLPFWNVRHLQQPIQPTHISTNAPNSIPTSQRELPHGYRAYAHAGTQPATTQTNQRTHQHPYQPARATQTHSTRPLHPYIKVLPDYRNHESITTQSRRRLRCGLTHSAFSPC